MLRVLYLFAGPKRRGDVHDWLALLGTEYRTDVVEVDLVRDDSTHDTSLNDLSLPATQRHWKALAPGFDVILASPPCTTFSRIRWKPRGPKPLRSAAYLNGFPWLSDDNAKLVALHNELLSFTFSVLRAVTSDQMAFLEHPEDLGRLRGRGPGDVPGSIWRSMPLRTCSDP